MLTKTELEMTDNIIFYNAILKISHKVACILLVIPTVSAKLQSTTEHDGLSHMKTALHNSLSRQFQNVKVEKNLIAVAILTPNSRTCILVTKKWKMQNE